MSSNNNYELIKNNILKTQNVNIERNEEYLNLISKVETIVTNRYKDKDPEKINNFIVKKCTEKINSFIEDEKIVTELTAVETSLTKEEDTSVDIENETIQQRFDRLNKERGLEVNKNITFDTNEQKTEIISDSAEVKEGLNMYFNKHDHSNDNIVKKINERENNSNILDTEAEFELNKNTYDINVPKEVALGNVINPEKIIDKTPKLLILDSGNISNGENIDFSAVLSDDPNGDGGVQPLKLEQDYEMVLEFLTLQNITSLESFNLLALELTPTTGTGSVTFNTYSNQKTYQDKYILPNEIFGKNDKSDLASTDNATDATSHTIKLKTNFMGNIQAGEYNKFQIKVYGATQNTTLNLLTGVTNEGPGGGRVILGILLK